MSINTEHDWQTEAQLYYSQIIFEDICKEVAQFCKSKKKKVGI